MTFGEKLKAARKEAGLSQEQLSEKLSVSRSAVAKWESDKGMPDVNNLKAMAQFVFGLQPELQGLALRPCLPEGWDEATAEKVFRGCRYAIRYRRTGEKALFFNGKRLEGDVLPLESGDVTVTF